MTDEDPEPWKRVLIIIGRMARVALFFFGIFTAFWFFFAFIGIAIGISYFLIHRKSLWRYHGLILAFVGSIAHFLAHRVTAIAPLRMALIFVPSTLVVYLLIVFVSVRRPENRALINLLSSGSYRVLSSLPKRGKTLLTILILLTPVFLWTSVSIDLEVMFDNNPRLLWVNAPTTVNLGSDFDLVVEAWDQFERLSAVYTGTVEFSIESYNLTTLSELTSPTASLPSTYTFTGQAIGSDIAYEILDGKDNGLHIFTASISTPGIHYILVADSITEYTFYSNPIIAGQFASSDLKIYWGDIHSHSEVSDGTGTPEHHYYYARNIAQLDFNALTDHGEIVMWSPTSLNVLEEAANAWYDPHHFVTFQGMEWTDDRTGHYTCIFSGDELLKEPIISRYVITAPDALWSTLDDFTDETGCRALAQPHHTTKLAYPQDWTYVNPKYVKLAEVTSVHGECLFEQRHPLNYVGAIDPPPQYTNGTSVIDGLRMGYRYALSASSDEHDGHPGHSLSHTRAFVGHQRPWSVWHTRNEHPYPGSLVAVYAQELTRDSIFTGLERQLVFASSDHGRCFLNFTINGTRSGDGSTVQVSDVNAAREIEVLLAQDGSPAGNKMHSALPADDGLPVWDASIEILKNGELLTSFTVTTPLARIVFVDDTRITGAVYGASSCIERDGLYFINEYSENPIDPVTLNTGGADFYAIRVVSDTGRMTYIGPIWVEVGP